MNISRRNLIKSAAMSAAGLSMPELLGLQAAQAATPNATAFKPEGGWLEGKPVVFSGVTWGSPWPRGKVRRSTSKFALKSAAGTSVPVQTWPIAYWPDGSLKWTAHAVPADADLGDGRFTIVPGETPAKAAHAVTVKQDGGAITVDTGVMQCRMARSGAVLIESMQRDGKEVARDGKLICTLQDKPALEDDGVLTQTHYESRIDKVTLESSGDIRAVVKVEGRHADSDGRLWLPFVVRLYFYAGAESMRVMHTIIYDGDQYKDFIRGLGLRISVPVTGEMHDRHIRFAGEGKGLFAEAVRGLSGLRKDPGEDIVQAQLAGKATPPRSEFPPFVAERLDYIPAFGDWTLFQGDADSFSIAKRTAKGYTWLASDQGHRAGGLGYFGTPTGGLAFGLRNFWQSFPAQLDIRNATTDLAEITLWMWAPEAPAMDMRPYHNGMGQDTYEKQTNLGLWITYEDYEPGFSDPYGVGRTSEIFLWALPATPSRERLTELADYTRQPPVIVAAQEALAASNLFGGIWAPANRSTPALAEMEHKLDFHINYYLEQREEHRWYGFWNYGDFRHTYDKDRHQWRYDVGGFAWDNSELATDVWLWLYYLHSARPEVFRMAEAMTRHTGEVDVYHIGRFAPLGTRHGVLHWGDSAKQLRISTVLNRRYYYYLTADERVGDLMHAEIEGARTLRMIQPERKVPGHEESGKPQPNATSALLNFGLDWGSIASSWITEWERTGSSKMRQRLLNGMKSIAAQPHGFFTYNAYMDFDSGTFAKSPTDKIEVSHLSCAFGLPEVCAELIQLLDVPEFEKAWLKYCYYYNATPEQQAAEFGHDFGNLNLRQGHSRLTAYVAWKRHDEDLARRAWHELFKGDGGQVNPRDPKTTHVQGPAVLNPVDEALWVTTNTTNQWGIAAITCLALIPEAIPPVSEQPA